MKRILPCLTFLLLSFFSHAQINKGIWLAGGSASFSSLSQYNPNSAQSSKLTDLSLSPAVGYFFLDKFAGGIKFSINTQTYTVSTSTTTTTSVLGPFVRYYLLPKTNGTNILAEGAYQYGIAGNNTGYRSNRYSVSAGPVFFLNTSVGLEVPISYTYSAGNDGDHSTLFSIGIGFQVHLDKK